MKKAISGSIVLLLFLFMAGYNIYKGVLQEENFLLTGDKINNLALINKEFDLYIKNSFKYDNFDIIQKKIDLYQVEFKALEENSILQNAKSKNIQILLYEINKNMILKIDYLEHIKSYRAILNNSFRIIQKIKSKKLDKSFDDIYTTIMTIDKNLNIDIEKELLKLNNQKFNNMYEQYFLKHSKTILLYYLKFDNISLQMKQLRVDEKLYNLHEKYAQYSKNSMQKAKIFIVFIFIIILILILAYLRYSYKLIISNAELLRFQITVQNSDNIVVITDKNQTIKYVNSAFSKTTGYSKNEIIGQKPNLLKSGVQSKKFYKNLNETIYSGKKWSGVFVNKDKEGNLSYEKASIMPVLNDAGDITEFVSIKLDITKETLATKELKLSKKKIEYINQNLEQKIKEEVEKNRLQDQHIIEQSRLAQMGEMLSMIAHQWRQPLTAISSTAGSIYLKASLGKLDKDSAIQLSINISEYSQHLSSTITDFRDFFKSNKEKEDMTYDRVIKDVLKIVEISIVNQNITLVKNINSSKVFHTYLNEVKQVVLNLIKNAEDVLIEKKVANPTITIETDENILTISDNGGGIPEDIMRKIFDPYFSTKLQKNGTGLGLYMSKTIIEEHCNGTITASNNKDGAVFKIIL